MSARPRRLDAEPFDRGATAAREALPRGPGAVGARRPRWLDASLEGTDLVANHPWLRSLAG